MQTPLCWQAQQGSNLRPDLPSGERLLLWPWPSLVSQTPTTAPVIDPIPIV